MATLEADGGTRLPEVRVAKVTNSQTVKIVFDHEMQFPNYLMDVINNSTVRSEAQID